MLRLTSFILLTLFIYIYAFISLWEKSLVIDKAYLFIFLSMAGYVMREMLKDIKVRNIQLDFKEEGFKLLCLIAYAFFTLKDIHVSPLWLDEYTHILNSNTNLIIGSSIQQQPPGGYALTKLLQDIIGQNVMTARMTGFLPMLLSLYLIISLFHKQKYTFYILSFVISSYYISAPEIRYVSLEGRSVAFGVFSMALWLNSLIKTIELKTFNSRVILFISTFVFLMSVGLQTLAIILLFTTLCFIYFFSNKNESYLNVGTISLISIALFLPIQINIFNEATQQSKFNVSFTEKISVWLSHINLNSFIKFFHIEMGSLTLTCVVIPIGLSMLVYKIYKKKSFNEKESLIFVFIVGWIVCFEFGFNILINWELQSWYFVCFSVLVVVALSYYAVQANKYVKIILLSSSLIIPLLVNTSENYQKYVSWRPDWQHAFEYIMQNKNIDRIYVLGRCDIHAMWCYDFFVGSEFYTENKSELVRGYTNVIKVYNDNFQDNGIVHDLLWRNDEKEFAIVIFKNMGLLKSYENLISSNNEFVSANDIGQFIIINSKNRKKLDEHLPQTLEWISQTMEKNPDAYYSYELLVWYNKLSKNENKAKEWARNMMSIPGLVEKFNMYPAGINKIKKLKEIIGEK